MKLYSHCKLFAGFCEYEEEIKFSVTMSFVLDHMTTVFFLVHRITYLSGFKMKYLKMLGMHYLDLKAWRQN